MRPKIAIVDYGMGNLRSVGKAIELAGARACVTRDRKNLKSSDAVVLPGVGSFGPALKNLRDSGLFSAVKEEIRSGKPFLGLCLGFQFMFSESEEEGRYPGFGIIQGKVRKFDLSKGKCREGGYKVPHMGWNSVKPAEGNSEMFKGIPGGSFFYFVHSYYAEPEEPGYEAGTTEYGIEFCSAVRKGNAWGFQFHPEKSGANGIRLLRNFVGSV